MTEPSGSGEAAGGGKENEDQFTPTVTSNVVMESFEFNTPVERLIYLDSVNSYLLLCRDGTACLVDANFETAAETIAEFGKPMKVLYAPSHGSLVLLDNSKVAVRRDLNGSYYVATALDNGSDQTRVRVEIPMDEAIDWHSYFSAQSPEELHVRPSLEEFAKNIESQVEKGKHSAIITVDGPQLLNELIMLTEGMSEANNCAYPMFPHGFGLMERLRLLLYPSKPYSYSGTDTTKGVQMASPKLPMGSTGSMAEAGFFHQNKEPGDDRVLCFACGVCLVFWEPSDEPYQEHERHSPNCCFITGTSNSNVPLAVSMSSLAPIRWSANDLGANSQIVSSVTSTSEWVAVGQNTSTKPAVYLFSLDSAVQKLHSFEVDLSDPFLAASLGISHETPGMRRVTWRDGTEPATEQNDPEARSEANQVINSVAEGSVQSHATVATELMALCCAGVASSREETGRVVEPETNICAVLIAGVRVEDWAAKKTSAVTASGDASEISLLNTVNSATAAEVTPRILPDDEIRAAPETEGLSPKAMRPLLLVYHVVEIASNKPETTSPGKQSQEPVATGKRLRTTSSALSTSPGDTAKSPNLSKSAVIATSAPPAAPKAGQSNPLLENDPWMSGAGANADGGAGFSEDPYDNWIQHDPYAFYENEYDDPKYAEKTDHAYNKLNEATENVAPDLVPLLYETSATSTVAMQCMRLPDELDSDAFKISTIAASDNNSGFVLVGVNRESVVGTESDFSSAIVAYARMDCVNMLQDAPLSKLTFSHGNIDQILLLHSDYFAMSRSTRVSAKPAVFTESALVRFDDGTLVLFDPLSQQSVKIDVESAADVTIGESGTLTVLSKSGKIFVCDIAQHLPRAKSDEDEELAISMLAALGSPSFAHKNADVPIDLIEHLSSAFASHPRISQVVAYLKSSPAFQKLTPMTLSQIWRLTRSDVQPLGASAMTSGTPLMTSSGAGYIQSSPGFQLHAASQWVESQQYYRSKRAASGSLPPVRRQDRPPATRSWVLSPGSDDVLSTYVFEMTILPGMPLSHVDVRFKFLPYSGGCPDLQVTVLQLKHDHRDGAAEPSTSAHAAHAQPMTSLSRFSENPDELRAKTNVVMGPLHLSAFIDATNHSSTVQLNASQLITAVSSEGDMAQHQGWLSHPHTYYLLVETLNTISAEQVVFRKAASSSNYATMLSRSSSATCKRGMSSPYVAAKSTSGSSTSSHAKKSHAQMKIRKGALTKSGKPPTAYKNTGGYKGSWATSSEKPSSASPWDIAGSGGSTQKAPTPSADLPQPNPADITCGMQWIEEISVTLYRSVHPGQSNDHLHRICLAQNADAHSELIRVAAAASAEFRSELASNSFCHDRLLLAQHQALDILLWLIGHWKTEANVRLAVRSAITCVIEHLPDIYTHGYRASAAIRCAQVDSSDLRAVAARILRRLTESVAQLYRVQKAGSLHWLLTLAFSVVYTSILYPESADVSKSVNEFLTDCVDCLSVVGQAWRRSWQSGVHVKLAQRYNLSGLPLELPMYDWPAHVLSIRSRTSTGSSIGSGSVQNGVTAPTSGSATPSTAYKALKYKTLPPFYSSSITSYPMAVIAPVSSYPPSMSVALAGPTSSAATSVDYKAVTSEQLAHLFQQLQKHNIAPPSSLMPTVLPSPGFASASKPIGLAGTPASKYYMYGGLGYKPKTSGSTTGPVAKPVSSSTPLPAHSAYQSGSLPTTAGDGMGPVNYVPITAQPTVPAVTDASATSQASASLTHETTVDEMQWTELFFGNPLNPEATAPPPPKSSTTSSAFGAPPAQGFPFSAANLSSGFSNGETDWYMRYRGNNNGNSDASTNQTSSRVVLGVDHMPGLLEAEPLSFTCVYGSDHVRVYNRDTTTTTPLPSLVGSASGGSGSADATAPAIVGKYSGSINSGDLASLKRQLQQHRKSKTGTAQQLPAEALSEEPHSETQASSASTFGVPTTPKTTPFLTPTPLSPINSETNLASHSSDDNSAEKEYKPQRPTVVNCSQTLFKSPPILSLAAERMTAGARKFVVLDFGVPVLLTDVLLPACEFTSTVSVDAWRYAENIDSIRLLFSSEIDRKSVALSDITPPALVRYVKVTYTARQLYNTTCMIPLGRFYGTRFISAWQLYACLDAAPLPMPVSDLGADPMALFTQEIAAQRKYLPGLVQLSEDLRCRHQLAASDLRQLVNEERPEDVVKAAYKECASLRLQWNIARSIIQRIETDQKPVTVGSTAESESSEKMECSDAGAIESWNDCGADQLRVASNALLALLNQTIHFAEVRSVAKQNLALLDSPVESLPQTPKADMDQSQDMPPKPPVTDSSRLLTPETAVRHFGFFCKDSVPLLQSQCCAWLFHYGSPAPWWPDFFPAVLRQYFSSPDAESADKVFLILAYLCGQSVKHSYMQGPVVQKLLELVIDLLRDEMQPPSTDSEDASADANRLSNVVRVDTALLSWTLLLLSSAFDVVVSNKRKNDRWAFLTGEFGVHFSAQQAPASSAPSRTLSTHKKPSSEKQQLNDYYKKLQYFKKLTDQLDKMEKNIGTFPQNLQNLDKLQKRLETLKKMGCALSSEMESSLGISLPAHVDHLQQPVAPPPPPQWNDFGDLDSAWSTAATYSDAISNAAIEIATTSAQSSSVAENGVPAVCEVPAGKSTAKADAGPSKTANAEQKTAETQTSSAQKRRIPPGLPRPPKQSRSSSSSFGGASNASKVRQYSVRLKLRMSLCLSFVRSLAAFMCRRASQLPVTTQLVAYKVMAKVSVHGAHYPTPLTAALHDNVKNLIGLALEQNDSPWLRHAVLCLLLDITDAEVRALNRNASPTSTAAASTRGQSEVAENPDARVGEDEPMEYEDSDTSVSISISLTPEGTRAQNNQAKRKKFQLKPSGASPKFHPASRSSLKPPLRLFSIRRLLRLLPSETERSKLQEWRYPLQILSSAFHRTETCIPSHSP
ncbi:ubiquitin-conjugating enzyme family protein, partial [Aphelenchoides avenae]